MNVEPVPVTVSLVVENATLPVMFAALLYTNALSPCSNVPLTRAIFTNMLPDYIVTSKDFLWKGLGGLNAAGYWDSKWNYDDRVGFCHREM